MIWIIGLFTGILILDCLFLILLIMVQLPKKEAGLGQAFGGGATDALFGAGSGNALTKLTKYATATFLILTLSLSVLHANYTKGTRSRLQEGMEKLGKDSPPPAAAPAVTPIGTNLAGRAEAAATNKPAPAPTTPATNASTEKPK